MTRDKHQSRGAATGRPERDPVQGWIWRRRLRTLGVLTLAVSVLALGWLGRAWLAELGPEPTRTLFLPEPAEPNVRRFGKASEPRGDRGGADDSPEVVEEEVNFGALMDEAVAELNLVRERGIRCGGKRFPAARPVRSSAILEEAAGGQATWMVEADDYAHRTPDNPMGTTPRQRARDVGYPGDFVGENLAWGQVSPRQAVNWWVRSPSHCKVLMAPEANEVGIGVEIDPETERGFVWVMVYGRS